MRVLHVFSTFALAGPQMRFVRLQATLGEDIHHIVAAMDNNFGAMERLRNAKNVETQNLQIKSGRLLAGVPEMRRTLQRLKPDVLVTYNFGSFEWTFANLLLGIPHIHVEEGFGSAETVKRLFRRNMLRRIGFGISNTQLLTVSSTINKIAQQEWGVKPSRATYIPNGVPIDQTLPLTARPLREQVVIGTVAGIRREKRIDRFVETIAMLGPQFVGIIVGGGDQLDAVKMLARELKVEDRIEFTGHTDDPRSAYPRFDIFMLTSDTEQMPMAVLEAMCFRLPIVATDVGDVKMIVDNSGFVVGKSAEELAGAVEKLADQSNRIAMGDLGYARVLEHYSEVKMTKAWRTLLLRNIACAPHSV
jgi:glycosyltransferase involved in cell wall biosynthesis